MTPITRKENYLNEIVGWGETAPEKPLTPEEFFFAAILGEAVQTPEPLTRYQMYLAKIAGREIEIPYPKVRLEYFLAKAAGMDVETPTPITREEILWSNYSAIIDFELEGIPPLSFKAKAGTLENYKIYGNTVGGAGVGDLVESGEHAGEYSVPVTVTNGTDTETTNIYLPEQIKMVGDEAEYVDYKEQKQHRVRKNLLQNTATNLKTYGVTITVNDDGSVTCNGTATSTIVFLFFEKKLGQNTYILSGCPENGAQNERYKMQINPGDGWYADIGNGLEFEIQNTSTIKVRLVIYPPYTCDNLTFYPMIRKADISDDTYEPYIQDTELDVTLPALPTFSGTNTLSVGTAVQPSKVYIKGQKEREYS